MGKILFMADLHDEFWRDPPRPNPAEPIDMVLLGGDLSTEGRHVEIMAGLAEQLECPVRAVRGNHEYYRSSMIEIIEREANDIGFARAQGHDVGVLDRDVEVINGVRLIGATLWTGLDACDPVDISLARRLVVRAMQDFRMISVDREDPRLFQVKDWLREHHADRDFILSKLDEVHDGPTVVMTHHMPCRNLIHPKRLVRWEDALVSVGFAADLEDEIQSRKVDYWFFGHSHDNMRMAIPGRHGDIEFLSNSRGYPGEGVSFDPNFVVEVGSPKIQVNPAP